jgi:hypothetical protein
MIQKLFIGPGFKSPASVAPGYLRKTTGLVLLSECLQEPVLAGAPVFQIVALYISMIEYLFF